LKQEALRHCLHPVFYVQSKKNFIIKTSKSKSIWQEFIFFLNLQLILTELLHGKKNFVFSFAAFEHRSDWSVTGRFPFG
jgi:hypothetical protein